MEKGHHIFSERKMEKGVKYHQFRVKCNLKKVLHLLSCAFFLYETCENDTGEVNESLECETHDLCIACASIYHFFLLC